MKDEKEKVRINVEINRDLHDKLLMNRVVGNRLTVSDQVREAIEQYLGIEK